MTWRGRETTTVTVVIEHDEPIDTTYLEDGIFDALDLRDGEAVVISSITVSTEEAA